MVRLELEVEEEDEDDDEDEDEPRAEVGGGLENSLLSLSSIIIELRIFSTLLLLLFRTRYLLGFPWPLISKMAERQALPTE